MIIKKLLQKLNPHHRKRVMLLNDFNKMDETLFLERLRNLTHMLDLGVTNNIKNKALKEKITSLLKLFKKRGFKDDGTLKWVDEVLGKYEKYSPRKSKIFVKDNIWSVISKRRSVRDWKTKSVNRNLITKILKAGALAPVSCNRQAWKFVVFRDDKKILKHSLLEKAPVVIIVFIDTRPYFANEKFAPALDAGYAAENMTLAAEALGLSSCSVYYARNENLALDCGIETFYKPFIAIGLGYAKNLSSKVLRKRLENTIVWK